MNLSWKDKSYYFKGLLLLIGKDFIISEEERHLLQDIGKALGFEQKFIDSSIDNLLENKYIIDEPPVFSGKEIAKIFIKDGIRVAISDKDMHPFEIEWLQKVAKANSLGENFVSEQIDFYLRNQYLKEKHNSLEVHNFE